MDILYFTSESLLLIRLRGFFFLFYSGPLNAAMNEKETFDNEYWKNTRFLHNRRDAFLLRKYVIIDSHAAFV